MPVSVLGRTNEGDIIIKVTVDSSSAELSLQRLIGKIEAFQARVSGKGFKDFSDFFNTLSSKQSNFLNSYRTFVDNYEKISNVWASATEKQKLKIAEAFGLDLPKFDELLNKARIYRDNMQGTYNMLRSIYETPTRTQAISSFLGAKEEYEQLKSLIPQLERIRKLSAPEQMQILPTLFGDTFKGQFGMKAFSGLYNDILKRRDELRNALTITSEQSIFKSIIGGFTQAYEEGYRLSRTLTGITFRAIYLVTVLGLLFGAVNAVRNAFIGLGRAFEVYNQTVSAFAGMVLVFSEKKAGENLGDQFLRSLNYAKQLYTTMEDIAATTLMTGEQANLMARQFLQAGIIIDANNENQKKGLQTIANVLFLLTQGQNQNVQIISELRNLLAGQITPREVFGTLLKSLDPNIKEKIQQWKKEGADALIGGIAELLQGMEIASLRISKSWTAVWTQLGTTIVRATRPAVQEIYNYLIDILVKVNNAIEESGSNFRNKMVEVGRAVIWIIEQFTKLIKKAWELREVLFVIVSMIVGAFAFRVIGGGIAGLAAMVTIFGKIKEQIVVVGQTWKGVAGVITTNSAMFLSAVNTVGAIVGGLLAVGYVLYTIHNHHTKAWREELEKVKFTIESMGGAIEEQAAKRIATLIQNTRKFVPEASKITTEEFVAAYQMGKLEVEEIKIPTGWSEFGEEIYQTAKVFKIVDDNAKNLTNTFRYLYSNSIERGREIRNQMVEQGFILETQIKLLTAKEERLKTINKLNTEEGQEIVRKLALYKEQLSRINTMWSLINEFPKEMRDKIAMTPDSTFLSTIAALEEMHPEFKGLHKAIRDTVFLAFMEGWYDIKKTESGLVFVPKVEFLIGYQNLLGSNVSDEDRYKYLSNLKKHVDELNKIQGKKGLGGEPDKAIQEAERYINRYLGLQKEYLELIRKQNDALIEQETHKKEMYMLDVERNFIVKSSELERTMDLFKTAYQNSAVNIDVYFNQMRELYRKQSKLEEDRIQQEKQKTIELLDFKIKLKKDEIETLAQLEEDAFERLSSQIKTLIKKSPDQLKSFLDELVQAPREEYVSRIESFVGKGDNSYRALSLIKNFLDNFYNKTEDAKKSLQSLENELEKTTKEFDNKLLQTSENLKKNSEALSLERILSQAKALNLVLEITGINLERIDMLLKETDLTGNVNRKYDLLYRQSILQKQQAIDQYKSKELEASGRFEVGLATYYNLLEEGKSKEAEAQMTTLQGLMDLIIGYSNLRKEASRYYDEVISKNMQIRDAIENNNIATLFGIGFSDASKEYIDIAKNISNAASEIAKAMEDAFMEFFDITSQNFLNFGKLATSILNDIYKSLVRALIVQPLVGGITSGLSSLFGIKIGHEGGIVAHTGGYIPRFHIGGLSSDEVPAILQKGEYVVSRKGVEALDRINQGQPLGNVNVVVNVENQTGMPVKAEQKGAKFDGEKYIIGVVLKNIEQYGVLRHAISGVR